MHCALIQLYSDCANLLENNNDAAIQIRHNSCVLREHSKVHCGDTLYLRVTRQGLHGGSQAKIYAEGEGDEYD